MSLAVDAASWALLIAGGVFCLIGAVGLLRMPDVFTRLHAVSVVDTLGAGFIVLGLMLQAGFTLVTVKLVIVMALILLTGPAATHALAQAALHAGVRPRLAHDETGGHIAGEDAPSSS